MGKVTTVFLLPNVYQWFGKKSRATLATMYTIGS